MTQHRWQSSVLVIADDFTGANDAGCGFALAGARVNVLFDSQSMSDKQMADVWVVSTDSRAEEPTEAAKRVSQALKHGIKVPSQDWIFKKIDSTLRGNLGAEVEAALLQSGSNLALIAPAVPKLGRITRNGECYIHGMRLTETEFASDPKTPVSSAVIKERLAEQSNLPCAVLDLEQVRGPQLLALLQQASSKGPCYLVVDAEQDEDLLRVVQAAASLSQRPVLVGAAGLSDALSNFLSTPRCRSVLAVVGSMSEISQRQIAHLQQQRTVCLVDVDISELFMTPSWPQRESWCQSVIQALSAGQHCVIRTCQNHQQRDHIAALCEQHQVNRAQLGEEICHLLAQLVRDVLQSKKPDGLYLSGGDVAIAVARGLGATGFQIAGQIAGCVPWGRLLNVADPLLVMTRAGGFGDENTLTEVIRFIEEKSSE